MKPLTFLTLPSLTLALCITRKETIEEAAFRARSLILNRSDRIGTLISNFPSNYSDSTLAGQPIGLQEYFSPDPSQNGDLILLAMPIAKVFHNSLYSEDGKMNISMTIKDEKSEREKGPMWAASRARLTIWGNLEIIPPNTTEYEMIQASYLSWHKDAHLWVGEDGPHLSFFVRLIPTKVFFFGGFGDTKVIDFLPMDLYRTSIPIRETEKEGTGWARAFQDPMVHWGLGIGMVGCILVNVWARMERSRKRRVQEGVELAEKMTPEERAGVEQAVVDKLIAAGCL